MQGIQCGAARLAWLVMHESEGEKFPLHSIHSQLSKQPRLLPQQPNGQFSKPKSQQQTKVLMQLCSPFKLAVYPWRAPLDNSFSSASSTWHSLPFQEQTHDGAFPCFPPRRKRWKSWVRPSPPIAWVAMASDGSRFEERTNKHLGSTYGVFCCFPCSRTQGILGWDG